MSRHPFSLLYSGGAFLPLQRTGSLRRFEDAQLQKLLGFNDFFEGGDSGRKLRARLEGFRTLGLAGRLILRHADVDSSLVARFWMFSEHWRLIACLTV